MRHKSYYTNEFKKDATKLNIAWPETVVPATSMIDDYIKFIQKLEADVNKDGKITEDEVNDLMDDIHQINNDKKKGEK